ncbi:MAG: tRNA (guanosine(37)-N1)-methyltransferase TrmD [Bdellovibrionota bacterium]
MKFDVISLFPEAFGALGVSKIWKNAIDAGLIELRLHDLRDFGLGPHKTVDDTPYGGGEGMLLKVEPLVAALESIPRTETSRVLCMSPQGKAFDQTLAQEWSDMDHVILICGRYEGFDERFLEHWVDECVSIGDYVLSGGELAAMVVMDTLSRLIPGVVGEPVSVSNDSFSRGSLKYPQYTRPEDFRGHRVPQVLLSGNHQKIQQWREEISHLRTLQKRPDLLKDRNAKNTGLKKKEK